jgi:predicted enzyme related to lactoylglutathione lyase
MVYITVDNLDHAIGRCQDLRGKVLRPATGMGPNGRYCVIEDPAGAVCALFEPAKG